jgi:ubiquinone/menaquinone biosynthesis C-methylase UbiE
MTEAVPADRAARIAAVKFDYASQPHEPVAACNLCGGSSFTVIAHRDRYGFPAAAHACTGCGLVFLNPRLTASAYGRFYETVYRPLVSAFHGRLIDATTIQAEQGEYADERIAFLRPFVSSAHRSLLDIGGSTGVVAARVAREFDMAASVVDPSPLELDEAARLGLETITGLVEQHDFGSRRFDVVLLCQTVDHLLDIHSTLARVRNLLTPHGLLFIDIVDFRAAYLREWSVEGAIKIDHPYYLTDATMRSFLARTGFHVMRSEDEADHLHIGYLGRPAQSVDAVPDTATVSELFREIRMVQNTPRAVAGR